MNVADVIANLERDREEIDRTIAQWENRNFDMSWVAQNGERTSVKGDVVAQYRRVGADIDQLIERLRSEGGL